MDEELLLDFIDTWNKKNPNERLTPYIISLVGRYFNMAKSMGYDMALNDIKKKIKHLETSKGSIMTKQLFGLMKMDNMALFKTAAKNLKIGDECWLKDYKTPFIVIDKNETAVKIEHKLKKYIKRLSPDWPVLHEDIDKAKLLGL